MAGQKTYLTRKSGGDCPRALPLLTLCWGDASCLTIPQDRVAQISGTKVDEGFDEAEDKMWVDVKDGDGQIWHIRWDVSP